MMLAATDGYILTALGSYPAGGKNSDAKITEHTLKNNSEDIRNWFKERDVLIVDIDCTPYCLLYLMLPMYLD